LSTIDVVAAHPCPDWLAERLRQAGGSVPFRTYMHWALHDPVHGAYASGRLQIGPQGDFTTAPSLGADFAALLAPQLAQWLQELGEDPVAIVETGAGEGSLAADLAEALSRGWPQLAQRCSLVLVDPSEGLVARQRQRLQGCPLSVRWSDFQRLAAAPVKGVMLAHEVLDALAVERILWDGQCWRQQQVSLRRDSQAGEGLCLTAGAPLPSDSLQQLKTLGLSDPGSQRGVGWCSELHPELAPWLAQAGAALAQGRLLVIDYALEAWRYYAPQRSNGTLMAYRAQQASDDPLRDPGHWDLTAHLCVESVQTAAQAAGWVPDGQCRQGEALLALGLAQRLHALQQLPPEQLPAALAAREALLRLVDPQALGDFRWLAFHRGLDPVPAQAPLFLQEPALG
jgi:SAM-dependent MidA family methyltransferase